MIVSAGVRGEWRENEQLHTLKKMIERKCFSCGTNQKSRTCAAGSCLLGFQSLFGIYFHFTISLYFLRSNNFTDTRFNYCFTRFYLHLYTESDERALISMGRADIQRLPYYTFAYYDVLNQATDNIFADGLWIFIKHLDTKYSVQLWKRDCTRTTI